MASGPFEGVPSYDISGADAALASLRLVRPNFGVRHFEEARACVPLRGTLLQIVSLAQHPSMPGGQARLQLQAGMRTERGVAFPLV